MHFEFYNSVWQIRNSILDNKNVWTMLPRLTQSARTIIGVFQLT